MNCTTDEQSFHQNGPWLEIARVFCAQLTDVQGNPIPKFEVQKRLKRLEKIGSDYPDRIPQLHNQIILEHLELVKDVLKEIEYIIPLTSEHIKRDVLVNLVRKALIEPKLRNINQKFACHDYANLEELRRILTGNQDNDKDKGLLYVDQRLQMIEESLTNAERSKNDPRNEIDEGWYDYLSKKIVYPTNVSMDVVIQQATDDRPTIEPIAKNNSKCLDRIEDLKYKIDHFNVQMKKAEITGFEDNIESTQSSASNADHLTVSLAG